jgi:broad specificity phosphatase PhoE
VTDEDDSLTEYGRQQAERLGNDWKNVHIDALHASTLQRAYDTALQIAKHNRDANLEFTTNGIYVERKMSQAVIDAIRAGHTERAATMYTGLRRGQSGTTPRNYGGGGESPEHVAMRARGSLILLLMKYGKELDEPPKEFLDKTVINSPNVLPEGIPHVVLVSHNIFLSELYESMFGWNTAYRMTTCDYSNANW